MTFEEVKVYVFKPLLEKLEQKVNMVMKGLQYEAVFTQQGTILRL